MGPPRLHVVDTSDVERAEAPFTGADPTAANDAVSGAPAGSGSPVHALIQSIEESTGPSMPVLPADPARAEKVRILEAVIFAAPEPVDEARLASYLKAGDDLAAVLADVQAMYAGRGFGLTKVAGKWAFRTADDLSWVLERQSKQARRLSKAGMETLAIVAYHQPVTRAEIEEVRGVTISKGTLDVLMEVGWVRPRGRRRAPGKPITYGTTEQFLEHFGLEAVKDLPGIADLKAAGLLDANLPPDFKMPAPTDIAALMPDELPLESGDEGDEPLQTELELEPIDEEGGEEACAGDDTDETDGTES